MFGEAREVTDRFGYTQLDNPDHSRRWTYPTRKSWAVPYSRYDKTRQIVNPIDAYVQAHAEVQGRFYDDIWIAAAVGSVREGKNGEESINFNTDYEIAANDETRKTDKHEGSLLGKLIRANEMLNRNQVSKMHRRYCILSAEEEAELLSEDFVTTIDRNYKKTLPDAQLPMIYGFEFIVSERLPVDANIRSLIAFAQPAVRMRIYEPLSVRVDERPDMNYLTQIYSDCELGAARTDDKQLIKILHPATSASQGA